MHEVRRSKCGGKARWRSRCWRKFEHGHQKMRVRLKTEAHTNTTKDASPIEAHVYTHIKRCESDRIPKRTHTHIKDARAVESRCAQKKMRGRLKTEAHKYIKKKKEKRSELD